MLGCSWPSAVILGAGDNGTSGIGEYINAALDDMRLYNRALTGTEIAALAKGPNVLKRDFDGDGKADLLFRHPSSGAVYLWLMR